MLNRSYELPGLDSEAYAQMKVSSTSPDGTSIHWVHRRRSLEVEEEIEREYYAGGGLLNVAAYAPLANLLLYVVYRSPDPRTARRIRETAAAELPQPHRPRGARALRGGAWRACWPREASSSQHSRKEETGENRRHDRLPPGHDQPLPGQHQPGHGEERDRAHAQVHGDLRGTAAR